MLLPICASTLNDDVGNNSLQQGSEAIGDDEPLSPISISSSVGSISSSHGSTARRRNKSVSPTNMSISSLPHVPDLDDGDDGNSIAVDGRRATMRETICAYAVSKSKALIFGQLLAFWLVSTKDMV